ncbi:Atp-binding protein [Globisporangium polare]
MASSTLPDEQLPPKEFSYESGKALMAHGPHALHSHVATKLETSLGRALPQMEVRFNNLSISADVVVTVDDSDAKAELPTITNAVKKTFSKFSAKKHSVRKEILKNVSGVFKPGSITLLLGQPGSGKSSLMKILSGRFPMAKNVTVEGDVTYNGQVQQEITKRLPQFVAYVNQRDKHFPTLTVKETLEFAHAFCGGELSRRGEQLLNSGTPEENLAALEVAKAMFAHYPEVIIEQLGLQNCQDTIVGDAMLRGVSGGERKRVTTGEMEFGMKYVTFMDEISTGLDSAAAFDIISTQRSIAEKFRKTVVIALLQPSPEIFSLFDDVMILNEGEVMYHGPCDSVVEYFQQLGFVCPPERDVADFLLDIGTKQQRRYEVPLALGQGKHPRFAGEFAEVFRQTAIHHEMLRALEAPYNPDLLENVPQHMDPMPEFHQSFVENAKTLMRRQLMVMMRNTAFLKSRVLMVIIMGLLYGSTFYQFDPINIQVVIGTMFQAVLFLSLGQASQIPTFMAAREVFYKQRGANFFRTSAYVLACSVSQIPIAVGESVIFGSLVYWMCGFVANVEAYFIYLIVVLLTNLAFAAWFFFLAAIAPDLHIAKPLAMITVLFFVLFAGFIVAKSQMPDYFIWIYWINPIAWCLRAVAVNQYRSPTFEVCKYGNVDYCATTGKASMGEYYLGLYDIPSEKAWVWNGMLFMIACYIFFMFLGYMTLEYKRYETPENITLKKDQEANSGDDSYTLVKTPKSRTSPGSSSSTGGEEVVLTIEAREKNFVPVTLAFKDLWYTVPLPSNPKHETIDLLKGITGFALPGSITALMGSSGAGKTTLMDVIAGRKTSGKIQGEILLNGYPATDLAIRRSTGYCEQMDIHSEAATIREALTFSAFLRQESSIPASKKYDSVTECLDLLDMHAIADQVIRGSSVEQMKRLTIGVELAAQPSVLFLDEPTSGLDARSAKMIMDGVRKVADSGRTVVCTIHQPSSEVFFLFDSLLLLKRGGETVFFGELGKKCRNLVDYFEEIAGVSPLPEGYNPATWMLECIGAGVSNDSASGVDFVQYFNNSEYKRVLEAGIAVDGVGHPSPNVPELGFSHKRAASSYTQMTLLVTRFMNMYWRTPSYNLTRFIIALVLALFFGLVFINAEYTSYQGLNGGVGMIFLAALFNGMVSFNSVLPISAEERASFYRERASQSYNALWYFIGSTVCEIPYVFASGAIFTVVFYPMVGFTGFGTGVLFWIHTSLLVLMQTYMGQLLAYAMPSVEVAAIIGVLLNSVFFLFMGFNPPASAIPSGYKWLYHITPQGYSLSILVALVFGQCDEPPVYDEATKTYLNVSSQLGCQPVRNTPLTIDYITVKGYVESVFGMKHDDIWRNFGVVIGCIVLFRVLALLSLRYINHQKR